MDKIFKLLLPAALLLCCIMLNAQQPKGDGSQANPYLLTNYADLQWFAAQVNGGQNGICAKLTADITVNTGVLDSNGDLNGTPSNTWTPIGGQNGKDYSGEFNGNGHTISGLYFNDESVNNIGLFGKAVGSASIHDLGIKDSYFCGSSWVGGICGDFGGGRIENCWNGATVIANSSQSGWSCAGGIAASCWTDASVRGCYNIGKVSVESSDKSQCGGICGTVAKNTNVDCSVSNCVSLEGKCDKAYNLYNADAVVENVVTRNGDAFESGEVCYLLNGSSSVDVTWHQKLGDGGDDYPVLAQSEGNTVYLVHLCDGSDTYSNTDHGTQAVHTPEYHPYTAPTETEDGNIKHWHCTTCGHNFEDKECTLEITGSVVLLYTTQLNNEIWYTSSTGQVVEPFSLEFGDCYIISNTYENGIGRIKFNKDVTLIVEQAFLDCISLTSVSIPASVTLIGEQAFSCCSSLTSVNIPASVTSIENQAFRDCSNLTSVTLNSNAIVSKTYSSNNSIEDIFGGQVKQYIIGPSVTSIGENAFRNCRNLTSVNIPSTVTSIGKDAFYCCISLTSVIFDGYRCENTIGFHAFSNVGFNVSATLTLPAEWAGSKPDNAGNWYGGIFSTVKYLTEEERVLGEMGTPCDDCPAIEVTDQNGKTIKLYNPKSVTFKKE